MALIAGGEVNGVGVEIPSFALPFCVVLLCSLRSFPPRLTTEGRIPRLPLLPRGMQETRSQNLQFTGEDDVRLHIMRAVPHLNYN